MLNFNQLVSDLYTETSSTEFWDCKDSTFCYQPAGHIGTGELKIITDSQKKFVQLFQKDLNIDSQPELTSINVGKQLPVL